MAGSTAKSASRSAARKAAPEKPKTFRPPGRMNVLSPHLVIRGAAKAIDFYKQAFAAEEVIRMPGPDGKLMHASLLIAGASVMLMDENPQWGALSPKFLNGTPVTMHLYVDDVDAAYAKAIAAGATAKMPPSDQFWGDRYGVLEDPFGHSWALAQHLKDMTIEEMTEAGRKFMGG